MAETNSLTTLVDVWITPTLEADYESRGVFPHLRIKDAKHKSGYQGVFEVPPEEAKAIFEDAQKQRFMGRSRDARGVTTAYTALVNRLGKYVNPPQERPEGAIGQTPAWPPALAADVLEKARREGLLYRAMLDAFENSPVRFHVGDLVVFANDGATPLVISREFGAFNVKGSSGLRLGYLAKDEDGEEHFYPAGELTKRDRKPSHLRLVSPPNR